MQVLSRSSSKFFPVPCINLPVYFNHSDQTDDVPSRAFSRPSALSGLKHRFRSIRSIDQGNTNISSVQFVVGNSAVLKNVLSSEILRAFMASIPVMLISRGKFVSIIFTNKKHCIGPIFTGKLTF